MITKQQLPKILLVEDNDDDAGIITSIYKKNNVHHTIDRVTNGEDALDYLLRKGRFASEQGSNMPNILLLSINLPKLNGIDLLRRLRVYNTTVHIPVFVFTSSASDYNAFESYRLGVISYISKQTAFDKFEAALMETELFLKDYKVLIVEDNKSDAAMIIDELTKSNIKCICELVSNKEEFKNALENFKPDIIFCDYDLPPKFDAIQAVRMLKQTNLKIPFILVTGRLDEDLSSACLTEGMDDYLLKGKFKRFPAALINNLRKKKAELDKLELIEMLQKKEFRFKQAQEMAHIGDYELDIKTEVVYLSNEACRIYGFPKSENELTLKEFMSFVHPEDLDYVRLMSKELFQTHRDCSYHYRIFLKNSTIKNILCNCRIELDKEGNPVKAYVIIHDLTIIKKNEIKLQQSLKKVTDYKHALDEANIVSITDIKGTIQYVNDSFCKISKYSREELIGQDCRIVNFGLHSNDFVRNVRLTIANGKIWKGEIKNKAKDGTIYWVDAIVVPFLNKNSKPYQYIFIKSDITQRKEAEDNLVQAVERYDILARATSDTIWDWDIINNKILYNDGITQMFGYDVLKVKTATEWWKEKLHSDDFKRVHESLEDIFENHAERLQLTYRFRCADGSYKYIFDRAFIIFDKDGNPARMIGAMQDITYQKEEEIRIAKAIIDAQEKERSNLGAELHDNINQILGATLLTLSMAKSKEGNTEEKIGFITTAMGYITDSINEIRKLSHNLAPAAFEDNTLHDLFENLLLNINLENRFVIRFHFDELKEIVLSENIQVNLYRILQEQTKNILKYSEATAIEVAVKFIDNAVSLRVYDNGKGFDIKTKKNGIGLKNIKKRAESLSGKFFLNSAPGKGCEIIVNIPMGI